MDVTYNISDLVNFIGHDPEAVIGFYGGEPLLALDKMYDIMDRVPAKAFTLQTNATHLNKVEPVYLNQLEAILVSVDGGIEATDANRHEGVYDTVLRNCRSIRNNGYGNDLVARMAFSRKAKSTGTYPICLDSTTQPSTTSTGSSTSSGVRSGTSKRLRIG